MRAVRLIASVSALTLAAAASAQTSYPSPYGSSPYASVPSPYTVQPVSDADLLASQIRLLAANPQDLQALVRAGELALKLDDDTAAAAFFARAERIDPRNARVKAGEGSLLVSAERPGDALRHFAEAERLGADVRSFAADRGLAYDLIGEQERAQRDYRLALRAGANDETQRRYALSLGISGKRELALTQIDTLLRKSDRGAWRARAFILAMAGDKAGATKIATSMMPTGMAQGLQPFFDVLPSLRPVDRAFAVHFGEVRPTLDRANDARLVPPLAALGPDPTAPVQVAAVVKAPVAVDPREERRRAREARRNRGRVQVAVATPPPGGGGRAAARAAGLWDNRAAGRAGRQHAARRADDDRAVVERALCPACAGDDFGTDVLRSATSCLGYALCPAAAGAAVSAARADGCAGGESRGGEPRDDSYGRATILRCAHGADIAAKRVAPGPAGRAPERTGHDARGPRGDAVS
jgi:tetratricopeptide (TPR) repeat protein